MPYNAKRLSSGRKWLMRFPLAHLLTPKISQHAQQCALLAGKGVWGRRWMRIKPPFPYVRKSIVAKLREASSVQNEPPGGEDTHFLFWLGVLFAAGMEMVHERLNGQSYRALSTPTSTRVG
jgi:hypothetical protein